jgi:hypothetical protein
VRITGFFTTKLFIIGTVLGTAILNGKFYFAHSLYLLLCYFAALREAFSNGEYNQYIRRINGLVQWRVQIYCVLSSLSGILPTKKTAVVKI